MGLECPTRAAQRDERRRGKSTAKSCVRRSKKWIKTIRDMRVWMKCANTWLRTDRSSWAKKQQQFSSAMARYLDKLNYDKEKKGELNEEEFVKFWADFYALFDKIDKDGDGEIAIVECVELLDQRADRFGLAKADLYKRVVHFYNLADQDGDRKISLVEFFIQLPQLEDFLLKQKLAK